MSALTLSRSSTSRAFSITSAATTARLPAPTLAMKCPRFVVPIIVPPNDMMPSVRARSRMRYSPGGSRPSKPSLKPTTSQPSFSAASTTPRRTAFNPGQSPPLVRTPIARFHRSLGGADREPLVVRPAGRRPLVVELPAVREKLRAFVETIAGCRAPPRSDAAA